MIKDLEDYTDENTNKILVGNKCDLKYEVDLNEANELAKSSGMQFLETSAKTGFNVKEMFLMLATEIKNRIENKITRPKSSSKLIQHILKPIQHIGISTILMW